MGSSPPLPHIAIFPFLSKGHTIPLLHLAHILHRRHLASTTFITTPLNAPFIRNSLPKTDIIELHFPENIPDIPPGVESTEKLPSMSLVIPFIVATKLLKPQFEHILSALQPDILISDGFYTWSQESASEFGVPRIMFNGMGNFASTCSAVVAIHRPHSGVSSHDQPFPVPGFPSLSLTMADLNPPFDDPDGLLGEFCDEQVKGLIGCHGILVNSFIELDSIYMDHWNTVNFGPRAWSVGPLCLAKPKEACMKSELIEWLDSKVYMNKPVLYVAFGSQAQVSEEQLTEIAIGLESSGVDFLWVVRAQGLTLKSTDRGRIVNEWINQLEILRHESVKGFMSHCGWNSVMESVSAGVPILAWPMMAEQHLNAKFVVDGLGIGLRVRASDGTKYGLVKREKIAKMVKELMEGEKGRTAAEKVKELAKEAEKAMMDGGSSAVALEEMIEEVMQQRHHASS